MQGAGTIYEELIDESVSYASWAMRHKSRFMNSEWLSDESLFLVPEKAKAILERKAGEHGQLKVFIGPSESEYAPLYRAGAVHLPLLHDGVVIAEAEAFIDRLRDGGLFPRASLVPATAGPQLAPVPPAYRLANCKGEKVKLPEVAITVLSSGFSTALASAEWYTCSAGNFVSMSFYLELVHRKSELVGNKIHACIALEKTKVQAKKAAEDAFHGPRARATSTHSGESLGYLCARYRKSTEELAFHLSESEFAAFNATFPILQDSLRRCTTTSVGTPPVGAINFYDVPFKTLEWKKTDTWVGRVLIDTFISTRECSGDSKAPIPGFLLLNAFYVDLL